MSTDYRAHPEPEDLTDEAILKTAAKELGYEFSDSWFLTGQNCLPLEAEPLELLNFARAVIDADRARAAVTQPNPAGVTDAGIEEAAAIIYESMRFGAGSLSTPPWMEHGNSLMQGEARRSARAILARYGRPAVAPVAVEALQRLRRWGGFTGSTGYSADVVLGVVDWIDGGMTGPLPHLPDYIAARATTPQEPQP
jgi:hypothetical protein